MKSLKLKLGVCLISLLTSLPVLAGNEGRGTESEKVYLDIVLANDKTAKDYHESIEKIKDMIQTQHFKEDFATFIQQVSDKAIKDTYVASTIGEMKQDALAYEISVGGNPLDIPYDFSRTENPKASAALVKEVLATTYNDQDTPCIDDHGVPREAVTDPHPRSNTCIYSKGLALLYVISKMASQNLSPEQSPNAIESFFFGHMSHELARKYDLDGGDKLPRTLGAFSGKQLLVYDQDCFIHKAFCETGAIAQRHLYDQVLSWAPEMEQNVIVEVSMPRPNREDGEWNSCLKDNFYVVNNWFPVKGYELPKSCGISLQPTEVKGKFKLKVNLSDSLKSTDIFDGYNDDTQALEIDSGYDRKMTMEQARAGDRYIGAWYESGCATHTVSVFDMNRNLLFQEEQKFVNDGKYVPMRYSPASFNVIRRNPEVLK